jgi:hypothetical protein
MNISEKFWASSEHWGEKSVVTVAGSNTQKNAYLKRTDLSILPIPSMQVINKGAMSIA